MSARVLVLAAGTGSRLMPYTKDKPKGMVGLAGVSLLKRQLDSIKRNGISDITIVGGYRYKNLEQLGFPVILNDKYNETNMVESLFCARELFDDTKDLIVTYADICFESRVMKSVLETSGDIVIAADLEWEKLWSIRMEDYLNDVETFKIGFDGSIEELGQKPKSLASIEAQYIGMIKIPAGHQKKFIQVYDGLDRRKLYDGQKFQQMYLTTFIQNLIYLKWNVMPAFIKGGWLEVDTLADLNAYHSEYIEGRLGRICKIDVSPTPAELLGLLNSNSPPFLDEDFSIRSLGKYISSLNGLENSTLALLFLLARKIEIKKELCSAYRVTEFGKLQAIHKQPDDDYMVTTILIFLTAYDLSNDYRMLNTALKGLDNFRHQITQEHNDLIDFYLFERLHEY